MNGAGRMDVSRQKSNLDSSILFMQQEHAKTLKGLHDEIEKLQKRCSELTFQIAMDNTSISQEDKLREKCESLEKQHQQDTQKVTELEGTLELKSKKITMLEQQLKAQERKYVDEIKSKKQTIVSMSKELDTKAGTIARLMTELHAVKVKLKTAKHVPRETSSPVPTEVVTRSAIGSAESSRSTRSSGSGSARSDDLHKSDGLHKPLPPKEAPPSSRRRPAGRLASIDSQLKSHVVSSRKFSASSDNAMPVPDPTPFLLLNREPSASSLPTSALKQTGIVPLPPISTSQHSKAQNDATLLPQSADSFKFVRHGNQTGRKSKSPSSPELEVETLAVDNVNERNHSLRRAHEYRNSDY